jgi:hypothetical protein
MNTIEPTHDPITTLIKATNLWSPILLDKKFPCKRDWCNWKELSNIDIHHMQMVTVIETNSLEP